MSKLEEINKEKTPIEELHEIRDSINKEIEYKTLDELKKYWKTKQFLHPKRN